MENKEIAALLSETADLMEIAGEDGFRIRSYRNGAAASRRLSGADRRHSARIRSARSPTSRASAKGSRRCWQEIAKRGSCERRDELLREVPARRARISQDSGARARRASR